MTTLLEPLNSTISDFAQQVKQEAAHAFRVLRETRVLTAWGTVGFIERVPGEDALVSVNDPGPFELERPLKVDIFDLEGGALSENAFGGKRYNRIFQQYPDITTVSHVHTRSLGAWAQTHRSFPFHYVPVQRFQLVRELPVYIDRRQPEWAFILETLEKAPRTPGIIEANGGATVWGRQGLRQLAEFIVILDEGADIQIRADAIGGSRPFGPGVLRQQWTMSGLLEEAIAKHLLPATDL
ncbi:MAG: class II aldolase/adducin family protein [Novosphingobium sp.]